MRYERYETRKNTPKIENNNMKTTFPVHESKRKCFCSSPFCLPLKCESVHQSSPHSSDRYTWSPRGRMSALLLSCVLGYLYTPAVLTWTVSQSPTAISLMRVNSSAEILCSTSLPTPTGLYLRGRFRGNRDVLFLFMDTGVVKRVTMTPGFKDRIAIFSDFQTERCCEVTMRLSQLRVEDTDSYYCSWTYFNTQNSTTDSLQSNGTIIIIRERDPEEICNENRTMEFLLSVLSVTAFIVMFILFIGALVWRCTRTKNHYTPSRARQRQQHHAHVCPQHQGQQFIYTRSFPGTCDFMGIL